MYLGNKLPEYVALNVQLVQQRFPDHETVLLVDSSSVYNECIRDELPAVLVDDPRNTWKTIKDSMSYSEQFRDDFWFKTVARFDAIRSYMKKHGDQELMHVEADVLLSPKYPLDFFESNTKFSIAYPLTNIDQGVASTFYVRDLSALEHFLTYSENCFKENSESTDVSILGRYYQDHSEFCWVMPTAPNDSIDFNAHVSENTKKVMSENYCATNGIFDASTWGQYLTGHDPMNSVGIISMFKNQNHHAIRTNGIYFRVEQNGRVFLRIGNENIEIFSLHVHSKSLDLFNVETSALRLLQISKLQYRGVVRRLKFWLFLQLLPDYLVYRLRLAARSILFNDK